MKDIDWNTKFIEERLMGFMLRMPLSGVFTIPKNKLKDLEYFIKWFEINNYFKDEGFVIVYNTETKTINKNPYFKDNIEFNKKHNLLIEGKPNLIKYTQYMKWRILEYRRNYASTRI